MQPQFEVMGMFPVPLYIGKLEGITADEERFIDETEYEGETIDGNRISRDRHILDQPRLARVKAVVQSHLDIYRQTVLNTQNELYITQSWTNKNGKGTQHQSHYHANSVISGTLYFNPDEGVPPIVFKSDRKTAIQVQYQQQNAYTADTFSFRPRTSVIILFPSAMEHFVPVNNAQSTRISLAFNTFVRGDLGAEANLTALHVD